MTDANQPIDLYPVKEKLTKPVAYVYIRLNDKDFYIGTANDVDQANRVAVQLLEALQLLGQRCDIESIHVEEDKSWGDSYTLMIDSEKGPKPGFTLWQKANDGDRNSLDVAVGEAETIEEAYALQDRILDGYAHTPGKHPYQVMIVQNDTGAIWSYGNVEFYIEQYGEKPEKHRKKKKRNRHDA